MGASYSFSLKQSQIPANGVISKIIHDRFSSTCGLNDDAMPPNLLRLGEPVKILYTTNLKQSRPNFEPITVSRVQFKDGTIDLYITKNVLPGTK